MKTALVILLVLVSGALGCRSGGKTGTAPAATSEAIPQQTTVSSYDDPDVYAIYNVLLGPHEGVEARASAVILRAETSGHEVCSEPNLEHLVSWKEAVMDYKQKSVLPKLLRAEDLKLGLKVELITEKELDSIFASGVSSGWQRFRQAYPGSRAYVDLSAVGLNSARDFALVYSGVHCGPLCGAGGFETFSKEHGTWVKNSGRLCGWIS